MKKFIKFLLFGGPIVLALFLLDNKTVFFESLESKTIENKAVYNKIYFQSTKKLDIWMMNQGHHGIHAGKDKWDRLAILVDKSKTPKQATFFKFPPGELQWENHLIKKKLDFNIACFMCHSNGPRAIRPNYKSYKVSLLFKLTILAWNLRIKSYGLVVENPEQRLHDRHLATPFRYRLPADNEELKVKTCTLCHNGENKWFNRAKLTRQNNLTAKFMVEQKLMPPVGFSLSEKEKTELSLFFKGL